MGVRPKIQIRTHKIKICPHKQFTHIKSNLCKLNYKLVYMEKKCQNKKILKK